MYPFRMYGRVVQIYRYSAEVNEEEFQDNMEAAEKTVTKYFVSEAEASSSGINITALDTSSYEWMDGIEVADVSNTYAEAIKIYEMGEDAYNETLAAPTAQDDTDAMLIDHEYRLTLLELGITE